MSVGLKEIGCLACFTPGWKPSGKFLELVNDFESKVAVLADIEGLQMSGPGPARGLTSWDWDDKIGGWQQIIT